MAASKDRKQIRESIARKGRFSQGRTVRPKAKKPLPRKDLPMDEPVGDDKLVVIARNPAEMQVAQKKLCDWASHKVETSLAELTEANESLEQAKKSRWRQTGFVTNVRYARERYNYYLKVRAALEAGYVIVPNFDLDIFAIRTTKFRPKAESTSRRYGMPDPSEFENKTDRSVLGEGEYVDPWPELTHTVKKIDDGEGKSHTENMAVAKDWRDVDFPYKLAKPQILTDTSTAMARMIFDQIGVSPNRRARNQDPMVIGQIVYKGKGYQEKAVSFLITWWVDNQDLEV